MHYSTRTDSRSPPTSSTIAGTTNDPGHGTTPVFLTSGFGAVMEKEHDLQASTEGYVGAAHRSHPAALDRILRHQQMRLGTNIALLEARHEMLPHPARFDALKRRLGPLTKSRRVAVELDGDGLLPDLVEQHLDVLQKIVALISPGPDGQRGKLLLTEIARNHEEMAWMLTALLTEDETVRDFVPAPVIAAAPTITPGTTEASWENEGGAPRAAPPVASFRRRT